MFKDRFVIISLLFIFIVAIAIRTYKLSEFPVGFHIDEASLGYNGYSLLVSGRDENNESFPLYIDMFGDNRPSGYHYLTIIPIKIFGLNEFATRLPGAFFGALSVFSFFTLIYSIFQDKKLAVIGSFLLSVAPWHVVLSRASAESVVALFFIMSGFSSIFLSFRGENIRFLILGTLMAALSFFFYHTPRIFVPLLLLSYVFWFIKKISLHYKKALAGSIILVSLIAFTLIFLISGGTGRFTQVNIFNFPETKLIMEEQIREDGVSGSSVFVTRFFHNKLINYSLTFIQNYLEYFSGEFLFIKGGLPIWYQVPRMGLLYLVELPFIVLGLILLAVHKNHFFKLPLIWIFIAPITAAITVDDIPNINRASVLFPAVHMVAAFGLINLAEFVKIRFRKMTLFIISIFFIFNIMYFLHQYFVHSKVHKTWFRNNGFKEMVEEIKNNYDSFDKVIVTKSMGGVYPLILFHTTYDPKTYQKEGSPKDADYSGFGKYFFVPQDCPQIVKDERFPHSGKVIYINRGDCPDVSGVDYLDINREDGSRAFRISYESVIE